MRASIAEEMAHTLSQIFLAWGSVDKLLMDNSTAFCSKVLKEMLDRWKMQQFFRAANKLSGNEIVENILKLLKP